MVSVLARRTLRDARTRTLSFAALFFLAAAAQVLTYASAYPTLADRLELQRSFGANRAVRLLYGVPHDLLTTGGWAAWRLGAMTIFAALWGIFAAVRALRTEEESGREELVLSGIVGRRTAFAGALAGIGLGALALWAALFAGLALEASAGGSAYLALALVSPAAVFVGAGALASQIAPTRRGALAIAGVALAAALLLRMVADTAASADWLRWLTPLGWAEELRPFADPRPLVLVLPAVATVVLLAAAAAISERRDVGEGLVAPRDRAAPRLTLLSSPTALALRTLLGGIVAWLVGVAVFALLMGVISDSVASGLSESLQRQLEKLGTAADTPAGYLGFAFLFFVLAISLFACFELGAVREEEAEQRLETLLTLPVGRGAWLAQRLGLIAAAAAALGVTAGLLAWVGAATQGADVAFGSMVGAGANCLPAALLFLGVGALALALVPRAGTLVAYAVVAAAFLWETIGDLLDAPAWLLGLSPFHHVGLVPAQSFDAAGAVGMLAIATAAGAAAVWAFGRRDLAGA